MQYILTEEEMQEVRDLRKNAVHQEALKNVCQRVANDMVDLRPPNGRETMTLPCGCIHESVFGKANGFYCDPCAVSAICPLPKRWSK